MNSNVNINYKTVYKKLLKSRFRYFSKKLCQLIQRYIMVIELIAALATIYIVTLLISPNLKQISYTKANIELTTSSKYTLSKDTSAAHITTSKVISRALISRDQMEDIRCEFDKRKRWVAEVCKTMDIKKVHPDATLSNMIIDTEHNVSWCPIYKVASSTWMNYFAVLKGSLTDVIADLIRRNLTQVSNIVRQKYQQDTDFNTTYKKMNATKKFLIVRHPLERLLSAYRDKLEHMQNREYYYKRFGRRIVLKYRRSHNITKLEPTFSEFLRFIVEEKHFDEHWMPYYYTCIPCTIHYDYILKFETLDRDQNVFIQDANLSRYLYKNTNYPQNINPLGVTTNKIVKKYIQGISRSLLDEIYKIYENDYKLFNYSFV